MTDRSVYFAKINREPRLFDRSFREDILEAIDPHETTTRYNRTWRFSRPVAVDDFLAAKLGFIKTAQAEELAYDEDREDFVTTEAIASEGSFSMFLIDPEREIIAFEERPPAIRRQSFVGAFKALLSAADFRPSINLLADPAGFDDFVGSVDRVARIRAVVYEPNPGWREDAQNWRQIVEDAAAKRAEIVAVPPEGGSLNTQAGWIQGALGQIAEHGQGNLKATGYKGETKHTWVFGARLQVAIIRDEDAAGPEGVWEWMRRKLREIYGR